ncbi:MAG: hypothetical protein R2814_15170 [Flavobacteriaceae bacterium]
MLESLIYRNTFYRNSIINGTSEDILGEGVERMPVNTCFWGMEMEEGIKEGNPIDFVVASGLLPLILKNIKRM